MTPWEERSPCRLASRSSLSPSTLTNTLAVRRSGLVSTEVTVTKPMRGSFRSPETAAPTTSRSTSLMRRMRGPAMLLQGLLDLFRLEELEHVVVLDVGVPLEDDAALLALLDFLDVVFEAAQGSEFAGPDHRSLADQTDAGGAHGLALGDDATGDAADLRGFEGLFDQRLADRLLDRHRVEQALHRVAQVFGDFVDDRVGADIDALARCR